MSSALDKWVKRIGEQKLPIFKHTITTITNITAQEDTSTHTLASIILKDPSLTARVLKLANSPFYNPSQSAITTISRAIVFIGFDLIRDMSMSLAVIDALLQKHGRKRVLEIMAKSLHGAVQAQTIAEERGDESPEEVFISALLYYLGEMSFWCVAGKEAEELYEVMQTPGLSANEVQQEVLGFNFNQLTLGLTQNWHLSDLLSSTLNNKNLQNPRVQTIVKSHALAESALKGWQSDAAKQAIQNVSEFLDLPLEETEKKIHGAAKKAVEVAKQFGAKSAVCHIPMPFPENGEGPYDSNGEEEETIEEFPEPDAILQLNILRELSGMMETGPNLNIILEMVLEGIYRGIGMDRTVFALITPDKTQIKAKFVLGDNQEILLSNFNFHLNVHDQHAFKYILEKDSAIWFKGKKERKLDWLINESMHKLLGTRRFFASPLIVNKRPLGLLYADRLPSGRELDEESFESFKHFAQQARMAITQITMGG